MNRIDKARQKLKTLSLQQRIAMAPRSTLDLLDLLLEEKNPQLILAALDNSHITQKILVAIVRDMSTPAEVLEKIAKNKVWMRSMKLQMEVIKNPHTPVSLALGYLGSLTIMDLVHLLGTASNLQPGLRQRMMDIFRQRISQVGEEQRVQLLGRGPSDVTQIIIDIGGDRVLSQAIKYNYIRQYHALRIARSYQSSPKILSQLYETAPWGQQYEIRWALINNENTPRDIRLRIFRSLSKADQDSLRRKGKIKLGK